MALDLRVWLREIVRRPGAFIAVVSSLAVAIGAVTAVLTIVDQTATRIAMLLLRDTFATIAVGLALGGVAMLRGADVLHRLMFGIQRLDAITVVAAAGFLLVVSFVTVFRPLRKACRLDPSAILREC